MCAKTHTWQPDKAVLPQYLLFSKEEQVEIEPGSTQSMEILNFVKVGEIDPVYFDASYYGASRRRCASLHSVAGRRAKDRLCRHRKITMHGRENIVIIRARENGFTLHTERRDIFSFFCPLLNEVRESLSIRSTDLCTSLQGTDTCVLSSFKE
jgi:hypothetical protein